MLNNWDISFWNFTFLAPHWLWLLLFTPAFAYYLWRFIKTRGGDIRFTGSNQDQKSIQNKFVWVWIKAVHISFIVIPILIIFALAKPFNWDQEKLNNKYKFGIDIIIAMDISESMLARDFEPNRLEASKKVAKEFIDHRTGDRIGLVLYGSKAYTACPATVDYEALKREIDKIEPDPRLSSRTAIGIGLGTAVTRLREDSKSGKVIILLTDGSNNYGDITPETAALIAAKKNVKVYTIGIGSDQETLGPVHTPMGTHIGPRKYTIDEETLINIAETTGGKYFRAKDNDGLKEIYAEIDKLEKRQIKDIVLNGNPPAHPESFLNWSILLTLFSAGSLYTMFKMNE